VGHERSKGVATSVAPQAVSTAAPSSIEYGAQPGTRYEMTWRMNTTTAVRGLPPQSTEVSLRGHVQVTALGKDGERRLVGVRLEDVQEGSVQALGRPLFPDEATASSALVGRAVVLAVARDGSVEDVYLDPAAPPLTKNLLMAMALHFAITQNTTPGASPTSASTPYVATEPTDFGRVPWTYRWDGDHLVRTVDDESGKGRSEIRFEGSVPIAIKTDLTVGTRPENDVPPNGAGDNIMRSGGQFGVASFQATRSGASSPGAAWPSIRELERHAPDAPASPLDTRASYLAAANGMTADDILFLISAYGEHGQRPRQGDLVRAAGFMRANPDFCDRLVTTFAPSPVRGKEFIVDLLSSSGDAKAQAAMRTVLAMPVAQRDRTAYQQMVQRFSFVEVPDAESVAFVMRTWRAAKQRQDDEVEQAGAYTLGSLAFHAARSNQTLLAESIVRPLLEALHASHDPDEELGLVAALGNTGMAVAQAPILARSKSPDVALRAQAATALRKYDDGPTRTRLLELVQDSDVQVAQTALRSLDGQRVGEAELTVLAEAVERGSIKSGLDPAMMTFVAAHRTPRDAALRIVNAVAARVGDRYQLQQQVNTLQGSLAAEPTPQ
jgi:hypothetical protein